jgi:nucleotide-binding universal stress UspA family protein
MIQHILVPVDFSLNSKHAALYAASLANNPGTTLHFIHVFSIPVASPEMPAYVVPIADFEGDLTEKITSWTRNLNLNIPIVTKVIPGFPDDEIVDYAVENHVDLIVMGMHETGSFAQRFLGSTSTSAMRQSKVPVVIVPEEGNFNKPKNITVAIDYHNELKKESLKILFDLKGALDYKLNIFHVNTDKSMPDKKEAAELITLEHLLEGLPHDYFFAESDDVDMALLDFCRQKGSDMLVMFPHKHNLFERIFKHQHTQEVAYKTTIPLLCIPVV